MSWRRPQSGVHGDVSHAKGYYADMLKCFSNRQNFLKQELVLFLEDDWLINTDYESMLSVD